MVRKEPALRYGAVYFRKSNPPREDWERDYKQAAKDGMNVFRHWFLWEAIEVAPDKFDFEEYDRQLDLAAENGIGTIIAEMSSAAPEWLFKRHPEYFSLNAKGEYLANSEQSASCATGGFGTSPDGLCHGGVCLDNPDARALVEKFLRTMARRYKGHPGLLGYDIWNECNSAHDICYCEHTQNKFRAWLRKKYGTLENLGRAWHRYSYTCWEDVAAPVVQSQKSECMDWAQFRKENAYEQMRWRIDIIRSEDPDCLMTAHGISMSLQNMTRGLSDEWMASRLVDVYGMTWVVARHNNDPWKQWRAVDLLRGGSLDKPFWHAEMQGGPLWLQPNVIGMARDGGRIATKDDVRLWNMVSIAGGCRGILYLRWRSLLDGPLFGAFGLYSNDGMPNDRSEEAAKIAKWGNAPEQAGLMRSRPVRGDIGIVVIPETQDFNEFMQQAGPGRFYTQCMYGAYRGFYDQNIQADFVHIEHIDGYSALYLPYPIHISGAHCQKLIEWVRAGGRLVLEGLPAYFGDNGRVGAIQPNQGFAEAIGVSEELVEFMPDLDDIEFDWKGNRVRGAYFRQGYKLQGATQQARYAQGEIAAVERNVGKGAIRLIGTFPSGGYMLHPDKAGQAFFADAQTWASAERLACVQTQGHVTVRLSQGEAGDTYLWMINHDACDQPARVALRRDFAPRQARPLWNGALATVKDGLIDAVIPGKDAVILQII